MKRSRYMTESAWRIAKAVKALKAMPHDEKIRLLAKSGSITPEQAEAAIKRLNDAATAP